MTLQRRIEIRYIQKKKKPTVYILKNFNKLNTKHTCTQNKTKLRYITYKKKKKGKSMEYHQAKAIDTQRKRTSGGTELPENKIKCL